MNTDYNKIDTILNKYFEGISSLEEEALLRQYFASGFVAEKHYPYKALFDYTGKISVETNPQPVNFKLTNNRKKIYFSAVASLLLAIGFIWFVQQKQLSNLNLSNISTKVDEVNPANTSKYKQNEAKKEIKRFANHIEKGVKNIGALSIFGIATQKVFKIDKANKKSKK